MALASTLARYSRGLRHVLIGAVLFFGTGLLFQACQSPMALDVDRTTWYSDSSIHPKRLSLYYYFGDSAYEAIVTDTAFLEAIWIERNQDPWRITIPRFNFALSDTLKATISNNPLVREFCLSVDQQKIDGFFRTCTGANSWLSGEYFDMLYNRSNFRWLANSQDRTIMLAWFKPDNQNLVKGRMVIRVANPVITTDTATYNGLFTIEL